MAGKGIRGRVEKYVLQNAIFYGGKPNPKAVMGKVLGGEPDLRKDPSSVAKAIAEVAKDVEKLGLQEQERGLSELAPEMLVKEERKQEELPPLPNAVEGKVVTRFAPSPTGPLNIAHLLRAAMMNFLYAEKYKGKFILRLEDTDPGKIEKRYYRAIQDDLEAAGIRPDRVVIESENIGKHYNVAERLISEGKAYMCACPGEDFRELKLRKQTCPCRDNPPEASLNMFRKARKGGYREGEVVLRFRTSMRDPNPAIRDPPMMRVSKRRHPLQGRRFSMWPLYNFANVVEDHEQGVTHVFRGKEHQHNTDAQRRMYEALGWEAPTTVNFGMIYLQGEKLHTRDIKEMIKEGKVSGWDDPRLHTVQALVRRGFVPEAFKAYAKQVGLTKSDIRLSWDNIESFNRSAIDHIANRYMVVLDPVRVSVKGAPEGITPEIDVHPDYPEKGKRPLRFDGKQVRVSREDWKRLRGKTIRLKNLFNVRLEGRTATYAGNEIVQAMPKIQWVSGPGKELTILRPDREERALAEKAAGSLKKGDLLQMERVGYGRVDRKSPLRIIWTHG